MLWSPVPADPGTPLILMGHGGGLHKHAAGQAARQITIPVEFVLPWDDPELDRDFGLHLFDAFGSPVKTLHAFPGSHFRVPAEQIDTRFFVRQLVSQ